MDYTDEQLKQALKNINDYVEAEFSLEDEVSKLPQEYDDLHHIPIGYTTLGDDEVDFQVEADLIDCSIRYMIDGKEAKTEKYSSLEEMNELALSALNFDELTGVGTDLISQPDITQGIFGVEDPFINYSSDEQGASVEFLVSANDNTYEEFAKRTPLIEESCYDSFDDLIGSDDYLNIYVTIKENGTVEAVIGISGGGELYPVALSEREQEALHAFVSRDCDKHMKSLDSMLAEANEYENPITSALENIYGTEFVQALDQKSTDFGDHGEIYEDSAREQKERHRDMLQETKSTPKERNKSRDFER